MEVYDSNAWGTVCDDSWDWYDAEVVCKSLGYGDALEAVLLAGFGEGSGNIVLDEVQCYGSESSIFDCGHFGLYYHDCSSVEDAGVVCTPGGK